MSRPDERIRTLTFGETEVSLHQKVDRPRLIVTIRDRVAGRMAYGLVLSPGQARRLARTIMDLAERPDPA